MRQLTLLQRQRITLSLFFTVAVGAVFTVAAPAFVPWQVVDNKRAQALEQQQRQGKDFHVVPNRRPPVTPVEDSTLSTHTPATSAAISSQGPLIALLTDRSKQGNVQPEDIVPELESFTDPSQKRKRRRRRKKVNEGWQEFTGRTAREEKERLEHGSNSDSTGPVTRPLGENGGQEISWNNKDRAGAIKE